MREYDGKQFVGIDLHRRRSVIVRMAESGDRLKTVRIVNDRDRLAEVMARATGLEHASKHPRPCVRFFRDS